MRARAQVVQVVVEHVVGQRPAVDHRRQAARRQGLFHVLPGRVGARRQRWARSAGLSGVGRIGVEQAERSKALLEVHGPARTAGRPASRSAIARRTPVRPATVGSGAGRPGRVRGSVRSEAQRAPAGRGRRPGPRAIAGPPADDRADVVGNSITGPRGGRPAASPAERAGRPRPRCRSPGGRRRRSCWSTHRRTAGRSSARRSGTSQEHRPDRQVDLRDRVDRVVVDRHERVGRPGQPRA